MSCPNLCTSCVWLLCAGRTLATLLLCVLTRSLCFFTAAPSHRARFLCFLLCRHDGPVWQVAWSHPSFGSLLASCGYDRRVIVHREVSPGQWTRIYTYEGHASSVNSIAWAPFEYGLQLATASSDGKVAVLSHRGEWGDGNKRAAVYSCTAL